MIRNDLPESYFFLPDGRCFTGLALANDGTTWRTVSPDKPAQKPAKQINTKRTDFLANRIAFTENLPQYK